MGSPDGEARYRDDQREGYELVIYLDEQGDAYVSVLPEGHKIGPSVRLCASGGASSLAPGLLPAIRRAFEAIRQGRHVERIASCPWSAVVHLLADGELQEAEAEGARAHAAGCAACRRDLEDALQIGALARSSSSVGRDGGDHA